MEYDSFIALKKMKRRETWNCLFWSLVIFGGIALYYYFAISQDIRSLNEYLSRIEQEKAGQEAVQPQTSPPTPSGGEQTPPPPPHLLPGMRFRGL